MTGRFATREYVLTYKQSKVQGESEIEFYDAFRNVLRHIFGKSFKLTGRVCYIQVPVDCCFYYLSSFLLGEFRKHPGLKGMRFRLDLRENLTRV